MIGYTAATPEEIAESFGLSISWVREQARRGRVPHLRFGRGKIRFLPEHIDALVKLATVEGTAPDDEPPAEASVDLAALGATVRSIRAHQRRPHVQGDSQMF